MKKESFNEWLCGNINQYFCSLLSAFACSTYLNIAFLHYFNTEDDEEKFKTPKSPINAKRFLLVIYILNN